MTIPNIIHFCFISFFPHEQEFSFMYYLAILSAKLVHNPDKMYFYYNYKPYGKWWNKVEHLLEMEYVLLPSHIGSKKIIRIQHVADVIRMQKLNHYGGIYLDLDTISIRPYTHLLEKHCVMGLEDIRRKTIGNAIIMSEKNGKFLDIWGKHYEEHFKPEGWTESSIDLPYKLIQQLNLTDETITVLKEETFYKPLWDHVDDIFKNNNIEIHSDLLILHLWNTQSKQYVGNLSLDWILENKHTLYSKIFSVIDAKYNLLKYINEPEPTVSNNKAIMIPKTIKSNKLLLCTYIETKEHLDGLEIFINSLCFTNPLQKNLLIVCNNEIIKDNININLKSYAFLNYDVFVMQKSSHNKFIHRLFEYSNIKKYDCCLYIDIFTCITDSLNFIHNNVLQDKIHVYEQRYTSLLNKDFSISNVYTFDQFKRMQETNKCPFITNILLVPISDIIESHFAKLNLTSYTKLDSVTDQQCINTYFLLNDSTDTTLLKNRFSNSKDSLTASMYNLYEQGQEQQKLEFQQDKWKLFNSSNELNYYTFETRNEMINTILPENSIIAEIGVFNGTFSKFLLSRKPKTLHLVDLWHSGKIGSGDVDGNNLIIYESGEKVYNNLHASFMHYTNVKFHKTYSHLFLSELPDNYLDLIYIDADHSYEGVKRDLEASIHKVKKYGWICGHDYEINLKKASDDYYTKYKFGVREAVDEFCLKYKLKLFAKGYDGCVSYAILKL